MEIQVLTMFVCIRYYLLIINRKFLTLSQNLVKPTLISVVKTDLYFQKRS